jgi:hypothetical protein
VNLAQIEDSLDHIPAEELKLISALFLSLIRGQIIKDEYIPQVDLIVAKITVLLAKKKLEEGLN